MVLLRVVLEALGVGPGDTFVYEIEGNVVHVKRLEPFDAAFHKALSNTLSEWQSYLPW